MAAQVEEAGAHRLGIGTAAQAHLALDHFLADQIDGDLGVKLGVEPADQSANLGARQEIGAQQRGIGDLLVEIFDDGGAVGQHLAAGFDQDRNVIGGIERQEFSAALPHRFEHQLERQFLFREDDAHLARERAEPVVVEGAHEAQRAAFGSLGVVLGAKGLRKRAR